MAKTSTEPWNLEKKRALDAQRECLCWLLLSESEAATLLTGTVPEALKPQLHTLADWIAEPQQESA